MAVAKQELEEIEVLKCRVKGILKDDSGIEHATLEIEVAGRADHDTAVIREGE